MLVNDIHKASWLASLYKYGKWYFISSFVTKGLGLILLPIYVKNLSTNEYGLLQSLNSIAVFLPIILSCSLDSAFGRFYHDYKNNHSELKKLFSSIYWFVLIFAVFVLFIIFSTSGFWIPQFLKIPVFPLVYLAFIPALFNQLAQLGRTFLEQSLQTKNITALDISSALINGGISVLLLVVFHLGIFSILTGVACAALFLVSYYSFIFIKKDLLGFVFDKRILWDSLKYSLPLMPAMAGSWISSLSDRLVIAKYVGLSSVGLYSFAYQMASIMYIVGDAITRVLGPIMMSGLVGDITQTKNRMTIFSFIIWSLMLIINFALYLFSGEIVAVLGTPSYYEVSIYIPILAFGYILGIQQRFPTQVISFHKKTWIISLGCILMACVNLILNLIFVPKYGYTMAIYNNIISNVFYVSWSFIFANHYEHIRYKWNKMILVFLIYVLMILIARHYIVSLNISVWSILLKLLMLGVSGVLIISVDKDVVKWLYLKYKK